MAEIDAPMKEAFDELYRQALEFLLPQTAERVDWSEGTPALESEIRPLVFDSQMGALHMDKLVRLTALNGDPIYQHTEFQGYKQVGFEKRVFDYNLLAYNKYHEFIDSTVIYCDEDPDWRPSSFTRSNGPHSIRVGFLAIKLIDWRGKEEELLASANAFALVVLAFILIKPTEKDQVKRAEWKLTLLKRAHQINMAVQERSTLVRVIDWLLLLPREANLQVYRLFAQSQSQQEAPWLLSPSSRKKSPTLSIPVKNVASRRAK